MEFEKALKNEIARMRTRLAELMAFDGKPKKRGPGRSKKKKRATGGGAARRKPVSAVRRKQMQEHGRYLAATRGLSPADKARVKKLRGSKGVQAAIRDAKRLSGKTIRKTTPREKKAAPHPQGVSG